VKVQAAAHGGCSEVMGQRVMGQGGEVAPRIVPDQCSIFIMLELESFNHTSGVVGGNVQHIQ